jgi:ABC-type nitrate/sulfonate/bicarbonate transport system permease component
MRETSLDPSVAAVSATSDTVRIPTSLTTIWHEMRAAIASGLSAGIAAEHICTPPTADGWMMVSSAEAQSIDPARLYVCPDCEQPHVLDRAM